MYVVRTMLDDNVKFFLLFLVWFCKKYSLRGDGNNGQSKIVYLLSCVIHFDLSSVAILSFSPTL